MPRVLLLGGLAGLVLGSASCRSAPPTCSELCARAVTCGPEVTAAISERLPPMSGWMRKARRQVKRRLGLRLLDRCPMRCEELRRHTWARERMRRCWPLTSCRAYGRCVAPLLEP